MNKEPANPFPSCHHCGSEGAEFVCQGCNDVDYCNRSCQKAGCHYGGHKLLCGKHNKKERVMHNVILDLFRIEMDFFQTKLTNAQLRKFVVEHG